ncbi:MAG: AMP-binding protein [Treponemataceae bacterium]|nr:AMP-binding protein [Treponemataceae bacterium]
MQTIKDLKQYTFPALWKNSLAKFSNRPALSFVNGTPFTYQQINDKIIQVSSILQSLGIKKGDRVSIFSTSMPNWGASYFGIVNIGAIAVPLLPDFSTIEVQSILNHAQVSVMFVAEKLWNKIKDLPESVLPIVIKLDDFTFLRGEPENFEIKDSSNFEQVEISEDDTASIIYTSGTTGRSKGVELSHKNLVWTAIQCQTVHRVNKRDKCLSFLPLSHVYEFTIGFVLIVLNGAAIYYLERPPTVSSLLPAFKKIRPTIVLSVPMIMEKIYKNKIYPTLNKSEFSKKLYRIPFFQKILHKVAGSQLKKTFGGRICFFGIGGAKVDTQVEYFLKDAKFNYAIGYGLTETSPLLAGSSPKETIPGTVGPILRGVELAIINPDEETGIGEVVARGPNVMKGYYKESELTKSVFTTDEDSVGEGWFKTGDLGLLHNGMWLELKGRLKNMILSSSGENIYPEDIEFVLNQHPLVNESLVVEEDGNLVALVQLDGEKLKKDGTLLEKLLAAGSAVGDAVHDFTEDILYKQESLISEIKFFVNEKVNKMSKITTIKFIENFEKTASQKIKRYMYNKDKKDKNEKTDK